MVSKILGEEVKDLPYIQSTASSSNLILIHINHPKTRQGQEQGAQRRQNQQQDQEGDHQKQTPRYHQKVELQEEQLLKRKK